MTEKTGKMKYLQAAAECAASFLLAGIFVLCMAAVLGIAPFGSSAFLYSDANIQYIDFFAYYKRWLAGETSILYTFEKTLGGNNIAVFSYYLSSPFNLLAAFFDTKDLPSLFTVLTLCKAAAAAATCAVYLRVRFPRIKTCPLVCLALGYALGQYTFSQASNTMWMDGVYMLPLILLVTYRIVQNRRSKLLLTLSVAASVLFNWYSAGINCLFCIVYYIYEDAMVNRYGGFSAYVRRALPFIACLALGVLLSAALFLPTLLALRGGRAGFDFLDLTALFANYLQNLFSAVTNFSVGATSTEGSVSLYCGFFAFIGMGAYFFTQAEKGRKRNASAVFLLFTALLFYVAVFIFAFSLFKKAESYWYRYSYAGSFAVLCVAARFYEKIGNEPIRVHPKMWWPIGITFAVLCIGWGLESFPFAIMALGAACWLAYVYRAPEKQMPCPGSPQPQEAAPLPGRGIAGGQHKAVCGAAHSGRARQAVTAAACLLTAAAMLLELGVSAAIVSNTYLTDNAAEYADYATQQQAQADALKEYDGSFYRVNQTDTRNKSANGLTANYNESLAYGYHSVNGYTSDPDNNTRTFLEKLGYRTNGLNMNIVNTSLLGADALLGVKYVFSSYGINGLEKIEELGTYNGKDTYYNPYALPMAFTYDPGGRTAADGNMFDYQNSLYSYLLGREVTLYRRAETSAAVSEDGHTVYSITVPDTPHALYASFQILALDYVNVWVNDGTPQALGGWLSPSVLYIPSGEGTAPTVKIEAENAISCDCEIYWLDLNELEKAARELQARAVDAEIRDGSVRCTVSAEKGERLYLSVPYEDGWKITVNGKAADYELIGGCMISLALEEGENRVQLTFSVPGLGAGIAVSILAAALTGLLAYTDAKEKRLRDLLPVRVTDVFARMRDKIKAAFARVRKKGTTAAKPPDTGQTDPAPCADGEDKDAKEPHEPAQAGTDTDSGGKTDT